MKIFHKVHCKAYLKKESDGIRLECWRKIHYTFAGQEQWSEEPAKGNAWGKNEDIKVLAMQVVYENGKWEDKQIADLSSFEGESVEKVYRKRIEEEFDGFLVGFTNIIVTGRIGTNYDMRPYNMDGDLEEIYHLTKETDKKRVGVVYFKNNARRYEYPEDMERSENG